MSCIVIKSTSDPLSLHHIKFVINEKQIKTSFIVQIPNSAVVSQETLSATAD